MTGTGFSSMLRAVARQARSTGPPDDPREAADLADAADDAATELRSLSRRVRDAAGLLAGRQVCDTPPDTAGFCLRCGRRTAQPIAEHNPGCLALPAHVVVRCHRLGRLVLGQVRCG